MWILSILCLWTFNCAVRSSCVGDFFGPGCKHKCHCTFNQCNDDGSCKYMYGCQEGWFGIGCQYQNAAYFYKYSVTPLEATQLLSSANNQICNNIIYLQSLIITWNMSLPFTWMRLKVSNKDQLQDLRLSFTDSNLSPFSCTQTNIYKVDETTYDVYCSTGQEMLELKLEGDIVGSICNIQVSQGRNVALLQHTWQSSTYFSNDFRPENAADGVIVERCYSSGCSHTDTGDTNPRWGITFDQLYIIYKFVLFNRFDDKSERLNGFIIEAKDENNNVVFRQTDTHTIAQQVYTVIDNNGSPLKSVNISKTQTSDQYVTINEFEAYGDCKQGKWGLECQHYCDSSCLNQCSSQDGSCPYYVIKDCFGFSDPPNCQTACAPRNYGRNCMYRCSTNCRSQCNATDGHCDVCLPGYTGDKCDQECVHGTYGQNCSKNCSQFCIPTSTCNNINGSCAPCKQGYRGDNCDLECPVNTYGNQCSSSCSDGCSNVCHKTDGQCFCRDGYKGSTCNETCQRSYGRYCLIPCSNHCKTECNNVNGYCTCENGYSGLTCNDECPNGTYGDKCALNCSQFCVPSTCNHVNGFCTCQLGHKGDKCDEVCSLGNWGPMCINNCSVHCYNTSCDFQTGSCNYGCIEGFQTANCTEPCNKTHYGKNCVNECSWNCTRSECNSTTGVCGECVPGRFGNYCDKDCPDGKYGQDCLNVCSISCKGGCHPVNGTCINGCQDGFLGPFCNETCDENHFGPACSRACSLHCEGVNNNNSRICHSVNGSCLLGCSRDFTGPQCFEAINSGSSPPVGAIVGAAIAALVIIALIIVAVVLWRRKHPKKERTSFKERNITHLILPEKDIEEKVSEEIETPKEDDDPGFIPDATYYNTSSEPLVNMSMPVHELNIYMKSHDKEFFTEQFKKIPQAQDVTTEVAENEKNKVKNRYKNICPYDHSRVHLLINTGKKEGDYINASYIRDNNDKVKFIASQGPNKAVLNDFIRMLWEQHVDIVVMLTNLVEEAKVKCEQYWPESGKVSYGDTKVQVIQAKTFADYTIRTIELNQYNGGTRILTQYHFTSWPDQSVPNSPWALVDLAMKVLAHPTTQPIVVHCSAGVGRTGTFIALHNVLKDAEETNRIDFYSTLVRLRQDRIFMIQTPDQYEFLHRAVQAALICTPTLVSVSDCSERVKELLKKEVSGLSKIEKEYRSINLVSKDIRNSQLDDNEVEKSTKEKVYQNTHELKKDGQNRFPNKMPRKFDRPYLVCEQKNMSDYINAVFTPALFKKDQHIITQLPMPQTVSDLWRLVKQYKISLMVAFELEKLGTDKTMSVYLPVVIDSSLALGNIEIHCTAINDKDLWEEQILKVRNEKSKSDSQDVVHLKCKDTEMDVKKLLSLVLKIRAYTAYTSGRTLFLCRNGATFSGLCSVLCTVLDRLDEDAKVSVPLVVGAMKTVRPEVIPNLEQYRIVYEVLERYCTTASPYTNVGGEKLPLTTPLTIPSHRINNPTFDENSTDPSSVYNNV